MGLERDAWSLKPLHAARLSAFSSVSGVSSAAVRQDGKDRVHPRPKVDRDDNVILVRQHRHRALLERTPVQL